MGVEIGTQPGETLAIRVAEIEALIAEVATEMPGLRGEVLVRLDREPFKAAGHEALLAALDHAALEQMGIVSSRWA